MGADAEREPTDELVLAWWNRVHGEHAETVMPEMAQAYMRQAARLSQLDAHLAKLLTTSEWAEVAARLPPTAPPLRRSSASADGAD
jgi:hypothetical protein